MADSDDNTTRNMLQYLIFALLLVIGLSPFVLMLWKNVAYRERLRDTFCCKDCSDLCTRRVHYDEADLRTLRELEEPPQRESVGITAPTVCTRRDDQGCRCAWPRGVKMSNVVAAMMTVCTTSWHKSRQHSTGASRHSRQ